MPHEARCQARAASLAKSSTLRSLVMAHRSSGVAAASVPTANYAKVDFSNGSGAASPFGKGEGRRLDLVGERAPSLRSRRWIAIGRRPLIVTFLLSPCCQVRILPFRGISVRHFGDFRRRAGLPSRTREERGNAFRPIMPLLGQHPLTRQVWSSPLSNVGAAERGDVEACIKPRNGLPSDASTMSFWASWCSCRSCHVAAPPR